MLRKGSTGLLRQALQYGLQQPVQQACVQLQVLNLQAVRFRSKPSIPKRMNRLSRADKATAIQKKAIERALEVKGLGPKAEPPVSVSSTSAVPSTAAAATAATTAAASDGSSAQPAADTPASGADQQAADSTSSSSSSSSSVYPAWMRNMFGSRGKQRGRAPVQASPLTPTTAVKGSTDKTEYETRAAAAQKATQEGSQSDQAAPEGADSQREGGKPAQAAPADGWESIMTSCKDFALDDYANIIKNDPNSDDFEAPPRPMTPLRGARAFYDSTCDYPRATYKRYEMLYNLITAMSPEDKSAIKRNPDFHKDESAMRRLAESIQLSGIDKAPKSRHGHGHRRMGADSRRTKDGEMINTRIDMIRDLVMTFHQKRREYRLMYEFRAAGGQMPPIHDGYQGEALRKKLTREYEQEQHKMLMALRDVKDCELRKVEAVLGRAPLKQICPQTALPYGECCGRKNKLLAKSNLRKKRQLISAA